jgi:glycosyltransferase involved in cell wall biosynthesis
VFVAAPRREDFGIAALEALAHGCVFVTTPSEGPYPARDVARALDPRLVTDDLAAAVRIALDDPAPGYAQRAVPLLEPYRRDVVDQTIAQHVLPRLLPGFKAR